MSRPTAIDPLARHQRRPDGPTLEERFWRKVDKTGAVSAECLSACWEWSGSRTPGGYGQMSVGRKPMKTHVVSWALAHGGIVPPSSEFVCHRCDNPACVRPDHLFLGTAQDNARDSQMKGRMAKPPRVGPVPARPRRARSPMVHGPLADWLSDAGFNENQLANALGVSRQAVNFWTTGVTKPTEAMAAEIAEFTFGAVPVEAWGRVARPAPGIDPEVKAMLEEIAELKTRVRALRDAIRLRPRSRRAA